MDYDFEKLAREIVTSRLRDIEGAPEVAAEIVKKIIVAGVTGTKLRQDPRLTVSSACRGAMDGMLLLSKNLPETSIDILNEMPEIAQKTSLDPQDLMTWCMEGIADVAALGAADLPHLIEAKIEGKFMGAGKIFDGIFRKAAGKPAADL